MNDLTTYAAMDLPDLLDAIHMEHDRAIRSAKTTIDHATRCGNMLLAAKEKVQHGDWEQWIDANTTLSSRNAQRYMRIASKASSMTLLDGGMGIAEALEMISTPTTLKVDQVEKPRVSRDAASVTIEAEIVEPLTEKESAGLSELEESIENVINPLEDKDPIDAAIKKLIFALLYRACTAEYINSLSESIMKNEADAGQAK